MPNRKSKAKSWVLWEHERQQEKEHDIDTVPPDLFAIIPPAPPWLKQEKAKSRGYFDDACDGFVRAKLTISGKTLRAKARIGVAPPHYAPDTLFVRNLLDDLEQAREGVEIKGDSRERALEIVRRAFEAVRFMNVAVMNGNPFRGRDGIDLDTMPAEEAFGNQRPLRPVFSPPAADTRAIMALHQRVFAAVTSGTAAWFAKLLRQPEEVADLTDDGRRKMPALMCGADSNYLALTRRQINAIEKIGPPKMVPPASKDVPPSSSEAPAASKDDSLQGSKQEPCSPLKQEPPPPPPLQTIDAKKLVRLRPVNKSAELLYKAAGQSNQFTPDHGHRQLLSGSRVRFSCGLAPAVCWNHAGRARQPGRRRRSSVSAIAGASAAQDGRSQGGHQDQGTKNIEPDRLQPSKPTRTTRRA